MRLYYFILFAYTKMLASYQQNTMTYSLYTMKFLVIFTNNVIHVHIVTTQNKYQYTDS